MNFNLLSIENFFSYGEAQVFDLSKPGIFLVTGKNDEQTGAVSNGSGKSTISEGIVFALYGQCVKDVKADEIVNEKTGKNCKVSLSFYIGSDYYVIDRYLKHEKYKDKVILTKNNENVSKANKKDTQEMINDIIKINFKSFINSILMSQENVGKFLEADSSKKKEIIENVLQLNIISQYHSVAQQKRKVAKKNFDRIQSEISNYSSLISNTKDTANAYVKSCKNQKEVNNKKIDSLKNKLIQLQSTDIESEKSKIKEAIDIKSTLDKKKNELKSRASEILSLSEQIKANSSSKTEFNNLISSSNRSISSLIKEISSFNSQIEELNKEIENALENPDKCPLCKNQINIEELNEWIDGKKKSISNIEKLIDNKNKSIEENKINIEKYSEKSKEFDEKISSLEKEKSSLKEKYQLMNEEIESIVIPPTMNEEDLNEISNQINTIENQIKALEEADYVDQSYLDGLINKAKELNSLQKEKNEELKKVEKDLILFQWWENSFSSKKNSMKSWCVNNIIGYFNTRIKYYMDRFFDGDTDIQLDIELNEKIFRNGYERSFAMFSGGEKQRLNLAILFALNNLVRSNLSTKINLMFLDEILSNSLDDKGISTVLELLEEMRADDQTVFLIDHKDGFKDYPSFNQIYIHKDKNGFSTVKNNA